ncbi:nucleobase cation symporter-1 (NCS1) family/cytosine/purines uracil thiamine allantoin permease [Komagataeibacter europaeus NBRC 3261]|uniref:Nucleobase cation symporter-1 (NCS1) family/cytosine/purines uracil thiamine allantoin permease n=1 Tax=Komagataeibacter europaeus NBRC 3261 TaxID=1234669 RepID=A0A0D6Q3Q5_KOMEU|nr:cytosine permease [Komagataeibacter europaeus]GAN97948.1 nucleobase cation symporter-1 (NCS1) family/cytosine/purines uracil thiamine allantoin permease [Komagataeibacter europaeus NBRC 3261]
MAETVPTKIESATIYRIPLDQRHGRPRDLFTIWFGSNLMMLTVVTGALATGVFGLPFLPALAAIIAGNMIGAIFMALHAAQGPRLGVPQMVQTRGQFGIVGAVPITALIVIMYVGFAASNLVLGGEGLQFIVPHLSRLGGILIIQALSVIPAIYGYGMIHTAARIMTWVCGVAIMLCLCLVGWEHGTDLLQASHAHISTRGLLGTISTAALWQIAYAPYVSDSSRYLPPGPDGERKAFHACFWGAVLGSVLPMALGAMIGLLASGHNIVATLGQMLHGAAVPVLCALSLSIAVANAMNVYCGALSSLTIIQTFVSTRRHQKALRLAITSGLLTIALLMAVFMARSFMTLYSEFLELLMSVMIPWTAINLTDYYLIHRGEYDVEAFFHPTGGRYGRYNKPAFICYFVGILIQIPFLSNALFTGPMARLVHGVDLSWIVGLVVTTPLYWWAAGRQARAAPAGLAATAD